MNDWEMKEFEIQKTNEVKWRRTNLKCSCLKLKHHLLHFRDSGPFVGPRDSTCNWFKQNAYSVSWSIPVPISFIRNFTIFVYSSEAVPVVVVKFTMVRATSTLNLSAFTLVNSFIEKTFVNVYTI